MVIDWVMEWVIELVIECCCFLMGFRIGLRFWYRIGYRTGDTTCYRIVGVMRVCALSLLGAGGVPRSCIRFRLSLYVFKFEFVSCIRLGLPTGASGILRRCMATAWVYVDQRLHQL